jgi:hypothetical protein
MIIIHKHAFVFYFKTYVEFKITTVEKLIENISRYLEARIELIKVDLQQKVAGAIVSAVQLGLIAFTLLFAFIFANLALANFLNGVIGNSFGGYLILAGFYTVLFFIVKASHKPIQARVEKMTDGMFSDENNGAHANEEVEVVVDSAPTHTITTHNYEDINQTSQTNK